MPYRIAVVIPVKNGEKYLAECFDSLLRQGIQEPFEVCVYDDGSTDSTPQLIDIYLSKFLSRNTKFCSAGGEHSGGVGYAKNQAVQLSSAQFLCFCDADDICAESRLRVQLETCLRSSAPERCIVGGRFKRTPEGSTKRFTEWACNLSEDQLHTQIYTSFGPTLVAPTWFLSRALYNAVGGFDQSVTVGFPEDLDFFYRALKLGARLYKVDADVVVYRYHNECATFSVKEQTLWDIRLRHLEESVVDRLQSFTIWNAGKQGKKFFRSLSQRNQAKVVAFCDVDKKKVLRGSCELYDDRTRSVLARIPIVEYKNAQPPVIVCVKIEMTSGDFESYLASMAWREGVDYFHFS